MRSSLVLLAGATVVVTAAFTYAGRGVPTAAQTVPTVIEQAQVTALEMDLPDAEEATTVWVRPEGPLKIALQAGHWKAKEAPDEQSGLRDNGTFGGGKAEWQVNLEIAELTATFLRDAGYLVEILPTTIPPGYWADLFIAIHADGSPSPSASGYRASPPRRDATGFARDFSDVLERTYGEATGLRHYPEVTRRMQNYYAFNYRRYEHALHPATIGVILETGFLTSPNDRRIIVNSQERAARGIALAVTEFLPTLSLQRKTVLTPRVASNRGDWRDRDLPQNRPVEGLERNPSPNPLTMSAEPRP